ncbi:energy transducer TonB [Tenacibaculum holothuriorum]|uniref:energy transducer TonB n=1 Tax=Tenacibaculum holothuriorum TaxID=1635173 RepID=UPI000A327BFD|nr:energy transducer TonB [Tenacibaculum holothuriorum]
MKKRFIIVIMLLFSTSNFFAQEVCESSETKIEDDFTINKCNVEVKKLGDKKVSKVAVVSKRYLKKRIQRRNKAVGIESLNTSGVSETDASSLKNNIKQVALVLNAFEKTTNGVSFDTVEEIPQFANCEGDFMDKEECFNYEMRNHIVMNLTYPEKAFLEEIEGDVWVSFVINERGEIKNIQTIGPENGKLLEKEAIRVVKKLPKFIPGKHKGKVTNVVYTFPINYRLQ